MKTINFVSLDTLRERERERERELYFTKIKYSLLRSWHKFNKEINKKIVAKPMGNIGL